MKTATRKYSTEPKSLFFLLLKVLSQHKTGKKKNVIIKSEYEIGYSKIIIIKMVLHIRSRFPLLLHDKKLK